MKDRGLVLIADDDSLLCRTIAAALRRRGYRTITARDGDEALLLAQRRRPDIMLIDFMMPVMDGMETARAIKNDAQTRDIPIVLLSAAKNSELERLTGADDVWWSARLEKPITMQSLVSAIERVVNARTGADDAASHEPQEDAARAYMRQTLERLDSARLQLEPGKPAAAASRAYELGLRHTRRLRDGAYEMNAPKLERLANEAQSLLEEGRLEGDLGADQRGLLHSLIQKMASALGLRHDNDATSRLTASNVTGSTKVPWLLLVCDDADFSIAAASRARFYGVCVNNVSQPELARGIAQRYPFAAIAIAGSIAVDAAAIVDKLRRVCPKIPIVVAGAGPADAHRAALKAGADRILPAGVEPERLIAAASELIHQGKPALGTVLAIAEDPAVLGMIESQLIDLGCNVVSVPSLTALSETMEVVQPDVLIADIGDSPEMYIETISRLRTQPRWRELPIIGIARDAAIEQSLAGHEGIADEIVVRHRLSARIRSSVFEIMRSKRTGAAIELDATTGALSREAFLTRAAQILELAKATDTEPTLAAVEIDTSALEARIGEGAADLMLKAVFQRVRDTFADRDAIIGRIDANYFSILITDANASDVRKELALAVSAFTPSVQIRTGGLSYAGGESSTQFLADAMTVVEANAMADSLPKPAKKDGRPVYILEDDSVLRTVLTEQLEKAGFDCHGYADGKEALDALLKSDRGGSTPVVLLDLDLPGLDGWSVLERLRNERPDIFRTVIMTADEDAETELKGLRAGASDYVVKPVKVPVMVERIRRLFA